MSEMTIDEVEDRIAKGITWLTDHDQSGAFHFWYESGIKPRDQKPSQPEERVRLYEEYYNARELWEKLWRRLQRMLKESAA